MCTKSNIATIKMLARIIDIINGIKVTSDIDKCNLYGSGSNDANISTGNNLSVGFEKIVSLIQS